MGRCGNQRLVPELRDRERDPIRRLIDGRAELAPLAQLRRILDEPRTRTIDERGCSRLDKV
jgi:hypothetical protein